MTRDEAVHLATQHRSFRRLPLGEVVNVVRITSESVREALALARPEQLPKLPAFFHVEDIKPHWMVSFSIHLPDEATTPYTSILFVYDDEHVETLYDPNPALQPTPTRDYVAAGRG